MSTTFSSPMNCWFSAKRNDNLGCWMVTVTSARMMFERTLYSLLSLISPEGMSMLTTLEGDALIYFTNEANPPARGLFNPEPNSPSTTSVVFSSIGGSNSWVTIVIECNFLQSASRCLLAAQSGERCPEMLKSHTSTVYSFSANNLATAKASPPLLPGPANTTTGVETSHRVAMACASAFAARSMRSIDFIGSFSIVNLSSSCIWALVNIFIRAKIQNLY